MDNKNLQSTKIIRTKSKTMFPQCFDTALFPYVLVDCKVWWLPLSLFRMLHPLLHLRKFKSSKVLGGKCTRGPTVHGVTYEKVYVESFLVVFGKRKSTVQSRHVEVTDGVLRYLRGQETVLGQT